MAYYPSEDTIRGEGDFLEAYPEGFDLVYNAYLKKIKSYGISRPNRYFPKVKKGWQNKYNQLHKMEFILGCLFENGKGVDGFRAEPLTLIELFLKL